MKAVIHKIKDKNKEQVIVECVEVTQEIKDICSYAVTKGMELAGMTGERLKRFCLEDVCYFEAVDEKVFACTQDEVYELKVRLYEVERAYRPYHFVRCSKSVVLNILKLDSISPALSGRFMAHMKNGEKLIISRQYALTIKNIVLGGGTDEA